MKSFGIALIIIGVIWAIIAFSTNTTVSTGFGEVNNIGLMADRQNHLIFSGLTILFGVILFGFGSSSTQSSVNSHNSEGRISCPFCAEDIKLEAKVCKHCGKDIPESTAKAANTNLELPPTIISKKEFEKGGYIRCNNCTADNKVSYKKCFRCDAPIITS
jgi:Double zinc ribbon